MCCSWFFFSVAVNLSDRNGSPLQFSSPTGFATYCRTLWGTPFIPGGPRYLSLAQNNTEHSLEKTKGKNLQYRQRLSGWIIVISDVQVAARVPKWTPQVGHYVTSEPIDIKRLFELVTIYKYEIKMKVWLGRCVKSCALEKLVFEIFPIVQNIKPHKKLTEEMHIWRLNHLLNIGAFLKTGNSNS